MKRVLSLSLLLLLASLPTLAQVAVLRTEMSDRTRPGYQGEYVPVYDNGQVFFWPKAGSAVAQKIDHSNVIGLTARFSGYYLRTQSDSLLGLRALASTVYSKTQTDGKYQLLAWKPSWNGDILNKPSVFPSDTSQIPGLSARLGSFLTRGEYQRIIQSDSGGYTKPQANTLFAAKEATQTGLGNRYTKPETDAKFLYPSVKDIVAAGGFTLNATGGGDNRSALEYALNNPGLDRGMILPAGDYVVSGAISANTQNVHLMVSFGARVRVQQNFVSSPVGGNDGRYVIRVLASNVKIENLQLDMTGKRCGGIMVLNADNVTVTGCNIRNWRGEFPGLHGIEVLAGNDNRIENNKLTNGDYAINVYKSKGTFVTGNFVDMMFHGGIYTVFTQRMVVTKNTVRNCGDVGVDSEGGANNTWAFNIVTRCKNGEAAIFSGNNADSYVSHHLLFTKNDLTRVAEYTYSDSLGTQTFTGACTAAYGACTIMSLDEGCYESGFDDNTIDVRYGLAFFHNQLADQSGRYVFFRKNKVTTYAGLWRCLNSDGLQIIGNEISCKAGTEAQQNETRDGHGLRIAHNDFYYESAKTSGYAILVNTSSTWASKAPMIEFNTFRGANGLALKYDPFQNGSLVAQIRGNNFGGVYTSTGGLSITTNGTARLTDQPLKVLLPSGNTDFSTFEWVARLSGAAKGTGNLGYGRDGFNGTYASLFLIKGNGNANIATSVQINAGGAMGMLLLVSSSGSTLTLTNNTGTATNAQLDLTLNSY